jgi:hypothetical protein
MTGDRAVAVQQLPDEGEKPSTASAPARASTSQASLGLNHVSAHTLS